MPRADLENVLIGPDATIRRVMERIDGNSLGIALVVDAERRLLGTVTDGDVRRAILSGMDLERPVRTLLERRDPSRTVTAPIGTPDSQLLRVMNETWLRHIPILDPGGRVVDLAHLGDLVREREALPHAVIMAGGFGTRLRPLTDDLPKPMLPVGDRPLLERMIDQLRDAGVKRVSLATHYKSDVIERHFGDGRERGIAIGYVHEPEPLGTAGALRLLEDDQEPLLVLNGDIVTTIDFRAMLQFHREHRSDMTVAVRQLELKVPYGVVETHGAEVVSISEKPTLRHFVSAGIYLLGSAARAQVPKDGRFDMPDLIRALLAARARVVSFPVREYWLDIGQPDDYLRAQADHEAGQL